MESPIKDGASYKMYFYANGANDVVLNLSAEELKNLLSVLLIAASNRVKKEEVKENAVQ